MLSIPLVIHCVRTPVYVDCYLYCYTVLNAGIVFNSSVFGQGIGPIFEAYINCDGSETKPFDTGCTHSNDVGVRCEPGTCVYTYMYMYMCTCTCMPEMIHWSVHSAACGDGQIRLMNGGQVDERSGVLQVCFYQRWGIVQNYFDSIGIVCRQLGYSNSGTCTYNIYKLPVHIL